MRRSKGTREAVHIRLTRRMMLMVCLCAATLAGCSKTPQLMPTPTLYVHTEDDPFAEVPEELRHNRVEVLYLTDRAKTHVGPRGPDYGHKRSRSVVFGIAEVQFGENVSWDELVAASRTDKRKSKLPVKVVRRSELFEFPPTPKALFLDAHADAAVEDGLATTISKDPDVAAGEAAAVEELKARLARTPVKEVFIFIHGVNTSLDSSVSTVAQLWHFLGRRGVPIAYSWPAGGGGGPLRSYTYDRESSEFTVVHLKEMLRVIADCPEVQKVHLMGHSRGTDVLLTALRELHIEVSASGGSTRQRLKLGTVVLAAPDLDFDIVIQRSATARLGQIPERTAVYICAQDQALGISNWLFSGVTRLGRMKPDMFTKDELRALRALGNPQFIDAKIADPGPFAHSYFHSNPAVSSDLVLLFRYGLLPGPTRPLEASDEGFWVVRDGYPGKELRLPPDLPAVVSGDGTKSPATSD
jgi:esterase/lipase superfamily enzyme